MCMCNLSEPMLAFCGSTLCCHSYINLVSGLSCAVVFKFACHAEDKVESRTAKKTVELRTTFYITIDMVCSGATAAPAPRGTETNSQLQPDQLTECTLTNFLDLICDHVRAEVQARQVGQPTVTEMTGQQATTGQATATTTQAHSTGAGMLDWGNWGEPGWAPYWRVEHGRGLCVCMYVTVC